MGILLSRNDRNDWNKIIFCLLGTDTVVKCCHLLVYQFKTPVRNATLVYLISLIIFKLKSHLTYQSTKDFILWIDGVFTVCTFP